MILSSVTLVAMLSGFHPDLSFAESAVAPNYVESPAVASATEITAVDTTQLISGLYMKKLKILGMLAGEMETESPDVYPPGNKVKMKEVGFIGHNQIAVTFDRKLESINVNDISFFKNGDHLEVKRAAMAVNKEGHTVIFYESATPINSESINMEDKIVASVVNEDSTDTNGNTLKIHDHKKLKDITPLLNEIPNLLTVSKDGLADYSTVQGAIDAIPANNTENVEVFIENCVYKELVTIPKDKPFIYLKGESVSGTVISYDNYSGKSKPGGGTYGTTGSASVYVYGDDFTAENITFENSFDEQSVNVSNKQAVAVYARGERQTFRNSRFIGNQDTLYVNGGTQYFYQSYIEGDVDFIFGRSSAVFEECEIFSLDHGSTTNNGFVTAASTLITEPYGFLFLNSRLLSNAPAGTVYLGRPWHPSGDPNAIGNVVFMNSYLGPHIIAQGWTDMSGFSYKDARFYEYQNYGPGAVINEDRRQLSDEEAKWYTIENVLKGWNPKE
ncbi:pectinesterase family protein [Bacillus sp. UNC41MFS5]|uniref:pectinesterase family protein n=1 Tax=Bacillus sp. UNC41MFS5 TaxID=1449046 RepID=UPI001E6084B6|nr:pectinesterase family protein [Bacillus sp. UNC41MFS5]